jgi:hypothetical protein
MAKVSEGKLKTIRTPYIDKIDSLLNKQNENENKNFSPLTNMTIINEKNEKTSSTMSLDESTNMGIFIFSKINYSCL